MDEVASQYTLDLARDRGITFNSKEVSLAALQRWFREHKKIYLCLEPVFDNNNWDPEVIGWSCYNRSKDRFCKMYISVTDYSYEKALEKGLQALLMKLEPIEVPIN